MLEDMDGRVDAVVDGGPCQVGVESTIVDLTCAPPRLLRPGGVTLEQLRAALGEVAVDQAVTRLMGEGEHPRAPGMKYRHYAPKAPVTVVTGAPERSAAYIATHAGVEDGILCFREQLPRFAGRQVEDLGPAGDPEEQARRVFDALRAFDHTQVPAIWTQCPDCKGIGLATVNRLNKAAGFHIVQAREWENLTVIGITGPTGAGKTTVLRVLEHMGAAILDCDRVYHRLTETCAPMRDELRARFGDGIFGENGDLRRKALGAIVFKDSAALAELNGITHRYITVEVDRAIARAGAEGRRAVVLDAIALLESGLGDLCDVTVAVTASPEKRVARVMARDGVGEEYARLRVSAQKSAEYFEQRCHHVLRNDGDDPEELAARARALFGGILTKEDV
jgi:L-threonylcarbamoyladenylate synthase